MDSTHTVLRDRSRAAQEEAERVLRQGEITVRLSTAVEEVGPNHVRVTGGRIIPADLVIWATGIEAPPVFRDSGLPTDSRGFLLVDDTLAVPGCPGLYGAGDAVSLASHPRASPRVGVHALRQGRQLAHNIAVAIRGGGADAPGSRLSQYAPRPAPSPCSVPATGARSSPTRASPLPLGGPWSSRTCSIVGSCAAFRDSALEPGRTLHRRELLANILKQTSRQGATFHSGTFPDQRYH